jgi:hypothetical protein
MKGEYDEEKINYTRESSHESDIALLVQINAWVQIYSKNLGAMSKS